MYNNNNKRLLHSPEQLHSSPKIHKVASNMNDVIKTDMIPENTQSQKLSEREQLMVNAFTDSMCRQLDIRFASFSKQEIAPIRKDVEEMKSDITSLNAEITALKQANSGLIAKLDKYDEKMTYMERETRERNLIFYNIPSTLDVKRSIEDVCKELLKIQEPIAIQKTVVLKEDKTKRTITVLAKFDSIISVACVLKNVRNLKGTNSRIGISRDMSEEERREQGLLMKLKKTIHGNVAANNIKIKVVGNSIVINQVKLTLKMKSNFFGNSNVDGRIFLKENYSIDFDSFLVNSQ